jgi:nucleotide-binding universal stress UspA family protein
VNSSAQRAPDPGYRTILVPLDGSHLADGAIPTARALAARFGATIHTVTVATSDLELQRCRAQAARALGTDPDDPRIHVEVDTDVAGTVHGCATDLDSCLVCLSTHGRGRAAGTLVGSTARDLIARGRQPVVVYDPISAAAGMKDYFAGHPTGLIAVTSRLRDRFARKVSGSGATDIVHVSTAPALIVPAQADG